MNRISYCSFWVRGFVHPREFWTIRSGGWIELRQEEKTLSLSTLLATVGDSPGRSRWLGEGGLPKTADLPSTGGMQRELLPRGLGNFTH